MVRQLAIVSHLEAPDQAGRAVRKEDALQRKRIGARSKARVAIAEMAADVKSGPVVDVRADGCPRSLGDIGNGRLDRKARRQLGRDRSGTGCQHQRGATPEFVDALHTRPNTQSIMLDQKRVAFIPKTHVSKPCCNPFAIASVSST